MARKSKYETNVKPELFKIKMWARNGLSDEQIAKNLNISLSTYYDYKNKFSEFSEALRDGKEISDYEVENALYKKATGHQIKETVITKNTEGETVTVKEIIKEISPDINAIMFWLRNRQPDIWRKEPTTSIDSLRKLDEIIASIDEAAKQ